MKIKKLNEFYQMNRRIQDERAYMPQTEMELINVVHTLFHDYFNGNNRFTKDVINNIAFDLSEIKDASPATQMVVAKNQMSFEDIEYIYFLGVSADEWEKNKNVFKQDDSEFYVDSTCCEFGIYTKAECYDISVCVLLDWSYDGTEPDDLSIMINKLSLDEIRFGRNRPVKAEAFKHLPCYEALEQYMLDLVDVYNYNDNIMYELYRAAEKDLANKGAMKMNDMQDALV